MIWIIEYFIEEKAFILVEQAERQEGVDCNNTMRLRHVCCIINELANMPEPARIHVDGSTNEALDEGRPHRVVGRADLDRYSSRNNPSEHCKCVNIGIQVEEVIKFGAVSCRSLFIKILSNLEIVLGLDPIDFFSELEEFQEVEHE